MLHFLIFFINFSVFTAGFCSWVGVAWWQDTGYMGMLKGKFCNKESWTLTHESNIFIIFNIQINLTLSPDEEVEVLHKPKIMIIGMSLFYGLGITWFAFSTVKQG